MKAYKIIQTIFNHDEVKLIVKKEDLLNVKLNKENEDSDNLNLNLNFSETKTLKLEQAQYLQLVENTHSKIEKLTTKHSQKTERIMEVVIENAKNKTSFLLVEEKSYKMLPELLGMFEGEKYDNISAIILN